MIVAETNIYTGWQYRTGFLGKICIWVKTAPNKWIACVKDASQAEGDKPKPTFYTASTYKGSNLATEITDPINYIEFREAKLAAWMLAMSQTEVDKGAKQ